MFSTWTLAKKISGVILIGLLSLTIIGVLSYANITKLVKTAGWVSHTYQVLEVKEEISSLLKDAETGQRGYLITGEQRYLEPYNKSKDSIGSAIRKIKELTSDNQAQQRRITELEGYTGSKFDELKETIDLRTAKGFEEAKTVVLTDRGRQVMDNIRRKLDEIDADERSLLKVRNEDAQDSADTTLAVVLWGSLVCLALTGALAFFVIRSVNATLRRSVLELSAGAEQVSSASCQVSSSSQFLAQGASEQAASLEETSASSEEMASMTRKNAENSQQAATFMNAVSHRITEANRTLADMTTSMHEIGASSSKISKIIKVIDEIAFQTNILALNAAVEAARAGEAGMGFAVVADEVRNLAQRSAQAAQDTAALIEDSILKSTEGSKKLGDVVSSIQGITEGADKVKTLIDEVEASSKEQAQGIEQISTALAQMDEVTQRTASNAEESAAASEELNAQSQALKAVVEHLQALVGAGRGRSAPSPKPTVAKRPPAARPVESARCLHTTKAASRIQVPVPAGPGRRTGGFPLDDSEFKEF